MTDAYVAHDWPELNAPVLIVQLNGFIDAGNGGGATMALLDGSLNAKTIVTFDPDLFLDFRARRPVMQLREGVNTGLVWPDVVLKHGRDKNGTDILLLTGHEPDMNWHRFVDAVTGLAAGYGVRLMIGLGAYPIAVPHTRASRLSVSASSAELAARVGHQRDSLDAPGGVTSALEVGLASSGIPTIGLWAQVPHYVSASPYPGAVLALAEGVHDLTSVALDLHAVRAEEREHRNRLDQLVASNPEHLEMLHQLEKGWDSAFGDTGDDGDRPALDADGPLPSGDELAAELEKFLRDQGR